MAGSGSRGSDKKRYARPARYRRNCALGRVVSQQEGCNACLDRGKWTPAVLVSRDGVPAAVTTIDASAQGIDQIVWIRDQASWLQSQSHAKNCTTGMRQDRQPPRHAARPQTAANLKNRPLCLGFDHLGLVCRQPFPYRVR
jgi:hypothetical protein